MNLDELRALQQQAKPKKHYDNEEHRIQCACKRWFNLSYPKMKDLLVAVPNGGKRDRVSAAIMKAEGVTAGVADLILFVPKGTCGALLIEMKTATGRQSPAQKAWQKTVEGVGYRYIVCHSSDEFIKNVQSYMKL